MTVYWVSDDRGFPCEFSAKVPCRRRATKVVHGHSDLDPDRSIDWHVRVCDEHAALLEAEADVERIELLR